MLLALTLIIFAGPSWLTPLRVSLAPVHATGSTYSVSIIDYAFQPLHVNITTGTTVIWTYTNSGKDFHTVTSDPGTNQTQGSSPLINSGTIKPGQSFSYTFSQPGYYPYQCSFHPALMNGWLDVSGAPVTPPSNPNPRPDYVFVTIISGVVAVMILATVALIVRRRKRATSNSPSSVQSPKQ
jgi:plastocyanin